MKKIISLILTLVLAAGIVLPASSESFEVYFNAMSLEELENVSETLAKIINEKKIGNAVLILDPAEASLAVGKTLKLAVSSDAREVTAKTKITMESSDENILTVNKNQIKAVSEGAATIKVRAEFEDGGVLTAESRITAFVPVTGLKGPQKVNAFINQETDLRSLITLSPENATQKNINFTVDDESIASINNDGIIKGLKGGTVTVTAASVQTDPTVKPVSIKVSIEEPVSTIKINKTKFNLGNGQTMKLIASVGPDSATNKEVVWSSGNDKIASVSAAGAVTGKGTGTTQITATAKDGSGVSATAEVTVITAVKSVALQGKEVDLIVGETFRARCEIMPANASNKKVSWTSSNSSVASVDETGLITAKKSGECTVTVRSNDGTGAMASMTVYVDPTNPVRVESMHWQTTWGQKNGKMGVYGTSYCKHRKIKSFSCKVECTSWFGGSTTDYIEYVGPAIAPGKEGKGKLSSSSVSGFTTATTVVITVLSVTFTDGKTYHIPSSEQEPSYFSM